MNFFLLLLLQHKYNNNETNNTPKKNIAELLKNIYIMSKILPEMFYGVSTSMSKKMHETNYPIFLFTRSLYYNPG